LAVPKGVSEAYNVEVVVTTIVTEYAGEALYPRATQGLEEQEGKKAHGNRVSRQASLVEAAIH